MSEKEELIEKINEKINYIFKKSDIKDLEKLLEQLEKSVKIIKKIEELENKCE